MFRAAGTVSDVSDVQLRKAELRAQVLARRSALPADQRTAAGRLIRDAVLAAPQVQMAGTIAAYYSVGTEPDTRANATSTVWLALLLVPIGALALYLVGGSPEMPAQPLADRIAAARVREAHEAVLIAELRRRLIEIDPHSEQSRQGYVLLGNA